MTSFPAILGHFKHTIRRYTGRVVELNGKIRKLTVQNIEHPGFETKPIESMQEINFKGETGELVTKILAQRTLLSFTLPTLVAFI